MPNPKTLKIFLLDGEPTGTKIVEIIGWTGKVFVIPRNKLQNILQRSELSSQAVYFLIGETEEGKQRIYVGEAEEFKKRIQQHNQNKDFWNSVICFISKDENLTKAHVKYLEGTLINEIIKVNRIETENSNSGSVPKLPESDEADMNVFLENLRMVVSSLGFIFLEDLSVQNENLEEVYYVKGRGAEGKIKLSNEGYVIQAGSKVAGDEAPSFSGTALSVIRHQILNSNKAIKKTDGNYELKENIRFSSPSYASSFILGRSSNGWTSLRDKNGRTLDELKRKLELR